MVFWYQCVTCEYSWVSDNEFSNREWCIFCDSPEEPELIYEEHST